MADSRIAAARLRACRARTRETLADIAALFGVNRSTVMRWEHGDVEKINRATMEKLAAHFGVDMAWLMGDSDSPAVSRSPHSGDTAVVYLPIVGRVSAGTGCYAHEDIEGYEMIPQKLLSCGEKYILLRVKGDSMYPRLLENDLVLVQLQESVDSGSLAVVTVDGDSGMVKRVRYDGDTLTLVSENPYYPPLLFSGEAARQVQIIGLVRRIIRDV